MTKIIFNIDPVSEKQRRDAQTKLKSAGYKFGTILNKNGKTLRGWC